jgi:hypothetical protein
LKRAGFVGDVMGHKYINKFAVRIYETRRCRFLLGRAPKAGCGSIPAGLLFLNHKTPKGFTVLYLMIALVSYSIKDVSNKYS